jgi:putative membrane protein
MTCLPPGIRCVRSSHRKERRLFPMEIAATMSLAGLLWNLAAAQPPGVPDRPAILRQIHLTDLLEIDAGRLAAQKGNSTWVRRLGDRIARDHEAADKKVIRLAAGLGVALPAAADSAAPVQEPDWMTTLRTVTGIDFDRTYLEAMIQGHQKAIDSLSSARNRMVETPLRNLISELLPILRQHLQLALDVQRRIG